MASRIPMPSARRTGLPPPQQGNRHSLYDNKLLPPTPRTPASPKLPTFPKPEKAMSRLPLPRSPRLPAVAGYPAAVPSPTVLANGFHNSQSLPSRRPRVIKRTSAEAVPIQLPKSHRAAIEQRLDGQARPRAATPSRNPNHLAIRKMQIPTVVPHTRMPKAAPTGTPLTPGIPSRSRGSSPPSQTIAASMPAAAKAPIAAPTPRSVSHASPKALVADLERLQDRLEGKLKLLCSPKQPEFADGRSLAAITSPAMTPAASQTESRGRLSRSNSVFSISLYDYDSDEGDSMSSSRSRSSTCSSDAASAGSSGIGRVRRAARVSHGTGSAYMSRRQSRQSNASFGAIEEETSSDDKTPRLAQGSRLSVDVEQAINQLRQHAETSPDLGAYFSPESVYSDNGSDDSHSMMSPAEWLASLKRHAEAGEDVGGDRRGRIFDADGLLLPLQSLPTPAAEKGFDFAQ